MIKFSSRGDFSKTRKFFNFIANFRIESIMHEYGRIGVDELTKHTPIDSSLTSDSWYYEITRQKNNGYVLTWNNSNIVDGFPVAIGLQYGHATRGGTYVIGRDYINPALRDIFDRFAEEIWRKVVNA